MGFYFILVGQLASAYMAVARIGYPTVRRLAGPATCRERCASSDQFDPRLSCFQTNDGPGVAKFDSRGLIRGTSGTRRIGRVDLRTKGCAEHDVLASCNVVVRHFCKEDQ